MFYSNKSKSKREEKKLILMSVQPHCVHKLLRIYFIVEMVFRFGFIQILLYIVFIIFVLFYEFFPIFVVVLWGRKYWTAFMYNTEAHIGPATHLNRIRKDLFDQNITEMYFYENKCQYKSLVIFNKLKGFW